MTITSSQFANPMVEKGTRQSSYHTHNGSDSPRIMHKSIVNFLEPVRITIPGTQAQTAANYGVVFIADRACTVIGFQEVHQTAASAAGAVTLNLEKLTGTTALGSGINLLMTPIDLEATANTIQSGDIVTTSTTGIRDASLAVGDRLALVDSGTLTSIVNVTVTIFIQYT